MGVFVRSVWPNPGTEWIPVGIAGGRSEYAQPDLDGNEAGRCGGADRRLHRDYPREHNSGGSVHGAGPSSKSGRRWCGRSKRCSADTGRNRLNVTRQAPPIRGVAATVSKQALISALPTPSFLADVK